MKKGQFGRIQLPLKRQNDARTLRHIKLKGIELMLDF